MKHLFILLLTGLVLSGVPHTTLAESAHSAFREGLKAYDHADLEKANDDFSRAAELAKEQGLDPAFAQYNAGIALYQLSNYTAAAKQFEKPLNTTTYVGLQAKSAYNLGNALFYSAKQKEDQGDLAGAVSDMESATNSYHTSNMLKNDGDATSNLNIAEKELKRLREKLEKQPQKKQQQKPDPNGQQKQDQQQQSQKQQDKQDKSEQKQEDQQKEQQQKQEGQKSAADRQPKPSDKKEQATPQPEKKAEEMTKEEAQMMLDAAKADENAQREQQQIKLGQPVSVDKDW